MECWVRLQGRLFKGNWPTCEGSCFTPLSLFFLAGNVDMIGSALIIILDHRSDLVVLRPIMAPNQIPGTYKSSLFGNVVCVDVIKLRIFRWRNHLGLSWWAQLPSKYPYKRGRRRSDAHTQRRLYEDREWSDTASNQGTGGTAQH